MKDSKVYKQIVEIGGIMITIRTIVDIVNIPKDFAEAGDYIIDNFKLILISTITAGLIFLVYFNLLHKGKIPPTSLKTKKEKIENNNLEKIEVKPNSGKKLKRNPIIIVGLISVLISFIASSAVFYSYLKTKNIYYAQIDSAINHEDAIKKVVSLNEILKSQNEDYLQVRALETRNNTYMITIRRGYFSKLSAEKALKKAELLLNDNPQNNRIYVTNNISWKKKIKYIFQ